VLEHVDDPISFLQSIRALLNINGKIYIDVPSVGQYSSTKDIHIAHLYHFSPNTLGFLLEQSGLKMLKMEEHAPPFHPKSLWSLSTFNHAITRGSKYSFSNDRVGWQQVRKLNRAMPLYLFSRPLIKALLPVRSSIKKYLAHIFNSHA
jgi:hypothetical protein